MFLNLLPTSVIEPIHVAGICAEDEKIVRQLVRVGYLEIFQSFAKKLFFPMVSTEGGGGREPLPGLVAPIRIEDDSAEGPLFHAFEIAPELRGIRVIPAGGDEFAGK